MDISTLQSKKDELARAVETLIQEFIKETGCWPEIHVEMFETTENGSLPAGTPACFGVTAKIIL